MRVSHAGAHAIADLQLIFDYLALLHQISGNLFVCI